MVVSPSLTWLVHYNAGKARSVCHIPPLSIKKNNTCVINKKGENHTKPFMDIQTEKTPTSPVPLLDCDISYDIN